MSQFVQHLLQKKGSGLLKVPSTQMFHPHAVTPNLCSSIPRLAVWGCNRLAPPSSKLEHSGGTQLAGQPEYTAYSYMDNFCPS